MRYADLGYNSFLIRTILTSPTQSPIEARNAIPTGSLSSAQLSTPMNPTTTIVFSSTDYNTAAWAAGVIYFADGTQSLTITAGNTGNIAATTYVYYDKEKSPVIQTTTTASNASGANKFMLAIVELGASGKDCIITPTIAAGLTVSGITIDQLSEISIQGWQQDMTFSSTDHNTVAWGSGTITLTDGTAYSIDAGNTGDISAVTYVYLDIATSKTVLQTTTTAATAVGSGKIIICVAEDVTAGGSAVFQVFGGRALGGVGKLIVASNIAANTVTANEIVGNTITAAEIKASTITTSEIAANTIEAGDIKAATITGTEISGTQLDVVATNTGTLNVDEYINVGESNVKIDGANKRILINDGTDDRILLGYQLNGF